MQTYIGVKVWKDDTALYFPSGVTRQITCKHVNEGSYGVNIKGEVFPLPSTTIPPLATPSGNSYQSGSAHVDAGNVYGSTTPFATGDSNYKLCIKIKDLTTLVTSYVDATDYAAKISGCNPS